MNFVRLIQWDDGDGTTNGIWKKITARTVIRDLYDGYYDRYVTHIPDNRIKRVMPTLLSVSITQEYNRSGQAVITLPKSSDAVDDILNLDNIIEIGSDYLCQYGQYGNVRYDSANSLTGTDGVTFYIPDEDDLHLCGWRGVVSRITEDVETYTITYDGELSLLSKFLLPPYTTGSLYKYGFAKYLQDRYNTLIGGGKKSIFISTQGASYSEGQSIYSSVDAKYWYDEVVKKIVDRMDACVFPAFCDGMRFVCIDFHSNGKPDHNHTQEFISVITDKQVLNVGSSQDISARSRTVKVYGDQQETQSTRPSGSYTATGTDMNYVTHENTTFIDEYEAYTTATLNSVAEAKYNEQIVNSNSINITLTPDAGKAVRLGGVYTINIPSVGIMGEYRLMKRKVDLFNPAKNTYTFGTLKTLTGQGISNVDGGYISQNEIDSMYKG